MADLCKSLGETKLSALPVWFKQNVNAKNVQSSVNIWIDNYGAKHFPKGKVTPLVHIMLTAGIMGYAMCYSHLTHDRIRKHH